MNWSHIRATFDFLPEPHFCVPWAPGDEAIHKKWVAPFQGAMPIGGNVKRLKETLMI